jgi:hypothetical protein
MASVGTENIVVLAQVGTHARCYRLLADAQVNWCFHVLIAIDADDLFLESPDS